MSKSPVVSLDLTIDSPAIPQLVTRFQTFASKTVEGVLEMGRVVYEASKLKTSEFARFCELVDLDGKDSTITKLKTIGEKYEFLLAHSSKLPANWTTVYEVARLTEDKISSLIESGVIKTSLVAQELNDALGKARKPSKPKLGTAGALEPQEGLGFRVRLSKRPDEPTASRIRELVKELRSLKLEVEVGSTLESFFQPVEA
jgi:hypothetical protein